MALSMAIRILLMKFNKELNDYAKSLLRYFLIHFKSINGECYVSHNTYALIHLADDAKQFETLENISAFLLKTLCSH